MLTVAIVLAVTGNVLLTHAREDELQRADAIVVLAGEHDGREQYGVSLAEAGWAPAVVLSNPYPEGDRIMKAACQRRNDDIEVICVHPHVLTTRGEAEIVRALAAQRSWHKIIVVSWRYHLPRARLVFRQCFSDDTDAVVLRAVPNRYKYSIARWELIYAYQYAGFMKAFVLGDCG
jgi:uncharacterized SAM-binding protein YcdF (DUF218 family)